MFFYITPALVGQSKNARMVVLMTSQTFVESLKKTLGEDRVLSAGELFPYAYDAALDKRLPGAVVLPRTTAEVVAAVRVAREFNVPFAVRGAGTNLCGGTIVPTGGLVIHVSRLNKSFRLIRIADGPGWNRG
jgi:glycolate oxidase